MRILITGVSGFIGSTLWSLLHQQKGFETFGISHRPPVITRSNIFVCPITDKKRILTILSSVKPDGIIHLAGGKSDNDRETFESNFLGTQCLLEALEETGLRKTRVVIPGTAAEYGNVKGYRSVTETAIARPINWYGLVKNLQVNLGLFYARRGMNVVIARIFNVMGYGTPARLALGRFARDIAAIEKKGGRGVLLSGTLNDRRDYLDVDDVSRALVALLRKGRSGEIYNVASGKVYPMRELLHQLIRQSSAKNIVVREKKTGVVPSCNAAGVNAKIKKATGWTPRISIDESLDRTLAFYRENP